MSKGTFGFSFARPFTEIAAEERSGSDADRLEQLRFHLETNDYFAFLATVFGIIEDGIAGKPVDAEEELELIRSLRKDLIYLQSGYRIDQAPAEA